MHFALQSLLYAITSHILEGITRKAKAIPAKFIATLRVRGRLRGNHKFAEFEGYSFWRPKGPEELNTYKGEGAGEGGDSDSNQ